MNFERLRCFLEIAEAGSMSAAAKSLHVTQPALSRSLKLLEEELGTSLFERKPRKLVLTPAGRALVPEARAIFDAAETLPELARLAARHKYHDLRIGSIDSVATYLLPSVLGDLSENFPDLHIKLLCHRSEPLLEQVRRGQLDVALCAYSGPPPNVKSQRVGRYRLQYLARRDRFPELSRCKSPGELEGFPLIKITPPSGADLSTPPKASRYAIATNTSAVKALVLSGFGVGSLLPFMFTAAERKLLVSAPIVHDPNCYLYLVTADNWDGAGARDITKQIRSALAAQLRH